MYITDQSVVTVDTSVFDSNLAFANTAQGGAIYVDAGSLDIRQSLFTANIAGDFLQVVDGEGGAIYATANSDVQVQETLFTGNQAPLAGGAVWGYGTYQDCEFTANQGKDGGAAFAVARGGMHFAKSVFTQNEAFCGSFCKKDGGAVYGPATLFQCGLFGNVAQGEGGAVYGASLRSCVLDGNMTSSPGGPAEIAGVFEGGFFESRISHSLYST